MPLYEYECRGCLSRIERRQHFSDEPLKVCPSCGGEMRRLLHPAGIIFKGSGWYVTDSRPKVSEPSESSSSGSSSASTPSTSSNGASGPSSAPSAPASSSSGSKKGETASASGGKS